MSVEIPGLITLLIDSFAEIRDVRFQAFQINQRPFYLGKYAA